MCPAAWRSRERASLPAPPFRPHKAIKSHVPKSYFAGHDRRILHAAAVTVLVLQRQAAAVMTDGKGTALCWSHSSSANALPEASTLAD